MFLLGHSFHTINSRYFFILQIYSTAAKDIWNAVDRFLKKEKRGCINKKICVYPAVCVMMYSGHHPIIICRAVLLVCLKGSIYAQSSDSIQIILCRNRYQYCTVYVHMH